MGAQPLRDLGTLCTFIGGHGILPFFDAPWLPIFALIIWLMHPALGVLTFCCIFVMLGLAWLNESYSRERTQRANKASVAATADIEAGLRNADVLRGMGMLPAWLRRHRQQAEAISDEADSLGEGVGWISGASRFLRMFMQIAILGLGAYLVLKAELTSGGMMAASILFGRALSPVERAIETWKGVLVSRTAYARVNALLKEYAVTDEGMSLPVPQGRLTVESLVYTPPGSQVPTLRNVNFALEPGQALCIVGPSGSGKTTLCRLLTGIVSPNYGHVRLDGADYDQWKADELGQYIGYLPQDVELFSGTVRENIARLGEASDEAVLEAAKMADVHDLILKLPYGYETDIGTNGALLSAGQRQRIGLARALYNMPKIVVLDEPNANLDSDGEMALVATLGTLRAAGTTVVMVTHRPSMMTFIDKMLVMREGQQAFFGNRDEIINTLTKPQAKVGQKQPQGLTV